MIGHRALPCCELRNQEPRRQTELLELFEQVAELLHEMRRDLEQLSLDRGYLRPLQALLLRRRQRVVGGLHAPTEKNTCPTFKKTLFPLWPISISAALGRNLLHQK